MSPLSYPAARRDASVADNYHGTLIPDPYRWLEDPDSSETKQFVAAQVALTDSVLTSCNHRDPLRQQITALFNHPRYSPPLKRGNYYFYSYNTGLQAQSVFYVQTNLDGEAEVLLDPNTLSADGTVAVNWKVTSKEGKYFAFGVSESGSDWVTIKVMRIGDKKMEPDTLSWVKFSIARWTHDEKGFFYSRYPAPKKGGDLDAGTETNINLNHEVYYHFMGTDQSEDILCWRDPEHPKYKFVSEVTDDGKDRYVTCRILAKLLKGVARFKPPNGPILQRS